MKEKTREELVALAEALQELKLRKKYNLYDFMFPDKGPLRRELYPRHIEFIKAGQDFPERMFSAANQVGKTFTLLYEGITHAMLSYPTWWEGKKFKRSTTIIFGAQTWEHIRDGLQVKLLGETELGTGLIPKDMLMIDKMVRASNTPGTYSVICVKNRMGGISKLLFKTYEAGRDAWKSMTVDGVFFDEEPPFPIYVEGAVRVLQRNGVVGLGFTPDEGMTETVLHFFNEGRFEAGAADGKWIGMIGWDDVPHLEEKAKKALLQKIPPYLREAKCKGIPYLGAGRVFPFDLESYLVEPFKIPSYWPKAYGIDPGIKHTAVCWAAVDPETDTAYVYDEYFADESNPTIHASVIREHGDWIPGVIDPYYGVQPSRESAIRIIELYNRLGLNLTLAERRAVESGIEAMKVRFLTGKLKIFSNCTRLKTQLNLYHRNSDGKFGATPHDGVDALRYLLCDGLRRGVAYTDYQERIFSDVRVSDQTRNDITGY